MNDDTKILPFHQPDSVSDPLTEIARAYAAALDVGSRWRKHIANSLTRMPETKLILDSLGM